MDWKHTYQQKKLSIEEILDKIPFDCHIVASHAAAEPTAILQAMAQNKERFHNVKLFSVLSMGAFPLCTPEMAGHFRYNTIFASGPTRQAIQEGRADYTPAFYSSVPSLIGKHIPADIAILSLSAPDAHGYCSFGLTTDYQYAAAQNAKYVIAQVNDQMPRTLGNNRIHINQIDVVFEISQPLPQLPRPVIGPIEQAIGNYCASLIQDGDTLELGIGAIPDAVLQFLGDKKDLGIHTEMFSDGVVELIEAGVITNRKKTINPHVCVATFLMGSDKLYKYVDNNPAVEMHPIDYTNDSRVIAAHNNFVAINSALQVDLTGQVCAESLGGHQFSGVGGQVDFVRGANMSKGGRAIIALPSTAKKGLLSRIALNLDPGSAVTTSRNDVDYIVTEYGVAQLRGKTVEQRAQALIAIAHPDFRERLRAQWEAAAVMLG